MKFNPNPVSFADRKVEAHTPELLESYNNSTYAWQPGMPEHLRVSKSSFFDFDWCPYSYKCKHIYRLKDEENENMVRGTNVHSIVQYYWENVGEVLDEAKTLLKSGKHLLAKNLLYSVIPEPPHPYRLGEEETIKHWFNWQYKRFLVTEGVDWMAVATEVSAHALIHVNIDGEEIPIHLRGYVDTIFPDGDGGFLLMELKTGKWLPKKTATKLRQEMQLYKLMLEEGEYGQYLPVTHWAWEFPRGWVNGGTKAEWELEEIGTRQTSYAPRTVQNKLKKMVKAHMTDSFEPTPHNWTGPDGEALCCTHYCSYMDVCPAFGMSMEEE